jgi:hypothetical protein
MNAALMTIAAMSLLSADARQRHDRLGEAARGGERVGEASELRAERIVGRRVGLRHLGGRLLLRDARPRRGDALEPCDQLRGSHQGSWT